MRVHVRWFHFIVGTVLLFCFLLGVFFIGREFSFRFNRVENSLATLETSVRSLGSSLSLLEFRVTSIFKWLDKIEVSSGVASWYGEPFHGRLTSSGEVYDMFSMTAASSSLCSGTMAVVFNRRTERFCIVRINDFGPQFGGRIIDLSFRAAQSLDMVQSGIDSVFVIPFGRGL